MRGANRWIVVLLVLAVAGAAALAVAPSAAATSHDQPTLAQDEPLNESNITVEKTNPESLTLAELRTTGIHPEGAPIGVRAASSFDEYRLQHLPTGFWVLEGGSSPFWTDVSPDTTVKRNQLKLVSKRPYDTEEYSVEPKPVVVRVAFWQEKTVRYQEGNQTRTRTEPTNVSVMTEKASLGDGYDNVDIDLPAHFDESYHMTVAIQEPGEPNALENPSSGTRWADIEHHSSRTAQVVEATSLGQKTFWTIFMMAVTAFFAAIFLYLSRRVIEGAAAPPRIPWYAWVLIGIGHIVALFITWDYIAGVLVTHQWLAGVYLGMILGIAAAFWFGEETYLAALIRFKLGEVADPGISREIDKSEEIEAEDAVAADGGDDAGVVIDDNDGSVMGVVGMDIVTQRLAKVDGERVAIGDGGLIPFLARFRDKMTKLTFDREATTRFDVDAGPFEEAWLLDPQADVPYEYEEEGLERNVPPLREKTVIEDDDGDTTTRTKWNIAPYLIGGLALAGSFLLGGVLLNSGILGLLLGGVGVYVFGILRPTEGTARAKLAPPHYNSAVGFMLQHSVGLQAANNWVDQFKKRVEDKTDQVTDARSLEEEGQQSQMARLYEQFVGNGDGSPVEEVTETDD